jgi:eukaryotic-like serine/threonine-protein kinase
MASVAFRCPHCAASLHLPEKVVGKRIKCPRCLQVVTADPAVPLRPDAPVPIQPTVNETRDYSNPHDESRLEHDDDSDDAPPSLEFLRPAQAGDELGRLGNFRILRELGRGGMGVVFLAEDLRLGRQVALKAMLPQHAARPKAKDRFLREAKTAASIENDHIITILQVDEDNGVPFLAMPVLKGEPLNERLRREKRLPVAEAIRIAWEICDGLAAAHDRKLVHRDLKPGNLWIESPKGRVKILDFGLARPVETDQHLTRTGVVVGTPAYMAPEQARNPNVDFRADLFSLGVVLYQMLAGKLPFRGHDALSTLMAICNDPVEPPAKLVKDLPAEMNELVLKLLAKDPKDRFASAQEVGLALEAINIKHYSGRAALTSETTTQPSVALPVAKPVGPTMSSGTSVPTQAETNPFSFRAKRDKLVSLSSSSERTLPAPPKKSMPMKPPGPMRPWIAVAAGLTGLIVLMVLVVIRVREDRGQSEAEVALPNKGRVVDVDKNEPAVKLPEPVAEVEDPFPQFDPTPLPPWQLRKDAPKPALAPFDAKQAKQHQKEWAAYLKTPVVLENPLGMKFVLIPPGEFDLVKGVIDLPPDHAAPKRRVRLTDAYYLGLTEVTYSQYRQFTGKTGYKTTAESDGKGAFGVNRDWRTSYPEYNWKTPGPVPPLADDPVTCLTSFDVSAFCDWLSEAEQAVYRLPTETEWENACRAGSSQLFGACEKEGDLSPHAWSFADQGDPLWNNRSPFHPVAGKLPNAFGLHDMLGNVYERCADNLYSALIPRMSVSSVNPKGARETACRGGGWNSTCQVIHPSVRAYVDDLAYPDRGFRVLRQIRMPTGEADKLP